MLVEVPDVEAVEWTRPEDFSADGNELVKKLVGLRKGGFLTAFADGATTFISDGIPPETLRRFLGRDDRETFSPGIWQRWTRFVRPDDAPAAKAK